MGQNPNTPIRIACMLKIYFQFLCAASHLNKGMAFFFLAGNCMLFWLLFVCTLLRPFSPLHFSFSAITKM